MTVDAQTRQALEHIEKAISYHNAADAELQHAYSVLVGMNPGGAKPPQKLRFDAPIGTQAERNGAKLWPGDWFDATGFAVKYNFGNGEAFHTGADMNQPGYKDVGQLVYAAADGIVVFVGKQSGWQGEMVTIEHTLETGENVWTRYAHLRSIYVGPGMVLSRGAELGVITDYTPVGPAGDHLHYDIARIDLGKTPGDWPGLDKARVLRDYYNPLEFTRQHHGV